MMRKLAFGILELLKNLPNHLILECSMSNERYRQHSGFEA
jgi:hypothetical protein